MLLQNIVQSCTLLSHYVNSIVEFRCISKEPEAPGSGEHRLRISVFKDGLRFSQTVPAPPSPRNFQCKGNELSVRCSRPTSLWRPGRQLRRCFRGRRKRETLPHVRGGENEKRCGRLNIKYGHGKSIVQNFRDSSNLLLNPQPYMQGYHIKSKKPRPGIQGVFFRIGQERQVPAEPW